MTLFWDDAGLDAKENIGLSVREDVVVIGAGAVGLAAALALLERGRQVTVLEASRVGAGSSHGNCGTVTPSHAGPLYGPGMIGTALKWMLAPDAPFYVKPAFDPALWAWLWRFARRCDLEHWFEAATARARILHASRRLFPQWVARHRLECQFSEPGTECVFRDQRALDAHVARLPDLARLGVESLVIGGSDYLREEPALREGVVGVVRYPGDARLRPDRYVAELARTVRALGGRIVEECAVHGVDQAGGQLHVQHAQGGSRADDVVVATGAWSPLLARSLGLRWLRGAIQPGKGYSITYSRPALVPKRPMTLQERRVCVTMWDDGFRLGSTMEFSGHDARLNRRRLDALERAAREYLVEPTGAVRREEWFGWRPVCWDDLPLIGAIPDRRGLWLATGHGMLGISMSVSTGALLAELMTGDAPHIDPVPYAPGRMA